MSYSIIFETKIVKLSDGRLLHLDLSGCNNDTSGRSRDDWNGKIYTEDAFIKYAEGFMEDSKPAKESDGFDLKIGSRYCTWYDYGKHLLRMMKRAITLDELKFDFSLMRSPPLYYSLFDMYSNASDSVGNLIGQFGKYQSPYIIKGMC